MSTSPSASNNTTSLTPAQIRLLAQLLHLSSPQPTSSWLYAQRHAVSQLPLSLRTPKCILARWFLRLGKRKTQKGTILCNAHAGLNPWVVSGLWRGVVEECGFRMERFESTYPLTPSLARFVERMRRLNALCASRLGGDGLGFGCALGGCVACALSVVGGNAGILLDLRASMLGRKKMGRRRPGLWDMVKVWIEVLSDSEGEGERVRRESAKLGREIRAWKREGHRVRRVQGCQFGHVMEDIKEEETFSGSLEVEVEMDARSQFRNAEQKKYILLDSEMPCYKEKEETEVYYPAFKRKRINEKSEHRVCNGTRLVGIPEQDEDAENQIIDFYARRSSTAASVLMPAADPVKKETEDSSFDPENPSGQFRHSKSLRRKPSCRELRMVAGKCKGMGRRGSGYSESIYSTKADTGMMDGSLGGVEMARGTHFKEEIGNRKRIDMSEMTSEGYARLYRRLVGKGLDR